MRRASRRSRQSTAQRRNVLIPTLSVIVLFAACGSSSSGKATSESATHPENVAFYYQRIRTSHDVAKLGKVSMVVASYNNDQAAVRAIHDTGAKAYRYVQTYWFPVGARYNGLDIAAHRDWAYCRSRNEPLVGRTDAQGRPWWFLDMNEQAVHQHFATVFAETKALGWDGVFFDRGQASMTGLDVPPAGIWDRTSTCAEMPVTPGATFADSYVGMSDVVAAAGLHLMINYGGSPFDAATPMRPDSRDSACGRHDWAHCPRLDDAWQHATWVLDEAVAHPEDQQWDNDYHNNQQAEQDPRHHGQVIGLITTGTLGGKYSRDGVYFEWARVKLFPIPLAVGTGDSGCGGVAPGQACNRQAALPELANVRYGRALSNAPSSEHCDTGSSIRCVWTRRYAGGMSVVNVRPDSVRGLHLDLGVDGCRYVRDTYSAKPLAGNRCVTSVSLDLPAWSGRPLEYRTRPL
jgi:hypothetical protein